MNILDKDHYGVTYDIDTSTPPKKLKRVPKIYRVPKTHCIKLDEVCNEKRKRSPTKIPPSPQQQNMVSTNHPAVKLSITDTTYAPSSAKRRKSYTTKTTKSSTNRRVQSPSDREYEVQSMRYVWYHKQRKGRFHVKWKNSKKTSYLDLGDFATPDQVKEACELALAFHNKHGDGEDD